MKLSQREEDLLLIAYDESCGQGRTDGGDLFKIYFENQKRNKNSLLERLTGVLCTAFAVSAENKEKMRQAAKEAYQTSGVSNLFWGGSLPSHFGTLFQLADKNLLKVEKIEVPVNGVWCKSTSCTITTLGTKEAKAIIAKREQAAKPAPAL